MDEISGRINGAHLKHRHKITSDEYRSIICDDLLLQKYIFEYNNSYECCKCHEKKSLSEYNKNKKGFPKGRCKTCMTKYHTSLKPKYKERIKKNKKDWNDNNKNKVKKMKRESYKRNIDSYKKYALKTRDDKNKWYRNKRQNDIQYKLSCILRNRLRKAVVRNSKKSSAIILLGMTMEDFKSYLESLFLPGMSWSNYGSIWHIDHIRPCSSFDMTIEENQKICFHYTNLQPLFAVTTVIDGIEYIGNQNKHKTII